MKKINNKGFTLIEVLAVIVIIATVGTIAVPSVINIIRTGKNTSYAVLIDDIKIAGQQLYEELEYVKPTLCHYNNNGVVGECEKTGKITINDNKIKVNLQTLVSNGFLTGINKEEVESSINQNTKVILNPKNSEDIGECQVLITKVVEDNNKVSYKFENPDEEANKSCPTDDDYQ